jgi:hypothetical protein
MRIAANQEKTVHKKKEEEKDEQANAQNTQKKIPLNISFLFPQLTKSRRYSTESN